MTKLKEIHQTGERLCRLTESRQDRHISDDWAASVYAFVLERILPPDHVEAAVRITESILKRAPDEESDLDFDIEECEDEDCDEPDCDEDEEQVMEEEEVVEPEEQDQALHALEGIVERALGNIIEKQSRAIHEGRY